MHLFEVWTKLKMPSEIKLCRIIVKFLENMKNKRVFFKINNLYRLGFGSFSDKAMVPFAMEKSRYQDIGKPTPYSFQHHLDLTDDDARFTKLIKDLDKDDGWLI